MPYILTELDVLTKPIIEGDWAKDALYTLTITNGPHEMHIPVFKTLDCVPEGLEHKVQAVPLSAFILVMHATLMNNGKWSVKV